MSMNVMCERFKGITRDKDSKVKAILKW